MLNVVQAGRSLESRMMMILINWFRVNRSLQGCGCVRLQASAPRMGALEYSSCSIALACVASKDLTLRRGRAEAAEAANISAVEGENAMQVDAGRWGP